MSYRVKSHKEANYLRKTMSGENYVFKELYMKIDVIPKLNIDVLQQ